MIYVLILSGCNWTSYIDSLQQNSAQGPAPISLVVQNKLSEFIPLQPTGGIPPYTFRVVSGYATIDPATSKIMVPVAGPVEIEIVDSIGETKSLNLTFTGNNSILVGAPTTGYLVTDDFSKIYFLRPNGSAQNELYRINTDGTGLEKIFTAATTVGSYTVNSITTFSFSPDNTKIAFIASDSLTITRLYVADMDGGNLIQLSGNYTNPLQRVLSFQFISNSKIVYRDGEQEDSGDVEPWMRVVNTDGTGKALIHPSIGGFGDPNQVVNYKFSSDLSKVYYFTEVFGTGYTGLYVSNSDGSSNGSFSRISPNGLDYWSSQTSQFPIASNQSYVAIVRNGASLDICATDTSGCLSYAGNYIFQAIATESDTYVIANNLTGFITELFNTTMNQKVTLDAFGATFIKLNGTNHLYKATSTTIQRTPLTTASPPAWTQISPVFPGFSQIAHSWVSPDHQALYFLVDDQTDGIYRVYKMNPDGSNAAAIGNLEFDVRADADLTPSFLGISSDQKRVLLRSGDDLYLISTENNTMVKITDRAQLTSTLQSITLLDDLKKLFYISNQNNLGTTELFKILCPF